MKRRLQRLAAMGVLASALLAAGACTSPAPAAPAGTAANPPAAGAPAPTTATAANPSPASASLGASPSPVGSTSPSPAGAASPSVASASPAAAAAASPGASPSVVSGAPASPLPSLAPAASAGVQPAAGPLTTVHVGLGGAASDAAIYIALDKGYFAEQGIEPDISRVDSLISAFPSLAGGQLDVAGGTVNVALFNAAAQDVPVKVVADKGSCPPGFGYTGLVVRPDLADTVKGASDLKGLRYVSPTANLPDTAAYLKTAGLTEADFQSTTVLDLPSIAAVLANKTTDVAYAPEPFLTQWQSQGLAVPIVRCDVMFTNQQLGVLAYSTRLVANADLGTRFMIAYIKGARDYNDAFAKNVPAAHDFAIDVLTRYTALKDPALASRVVPAGLNPDGTVNTDSMNAYQDFYLQLGTQKQRIDISRMVEPSFVQAAVARLGPYTR